MSGETESCCVILDACACVCVFLLVYLDQGTSRGGWFCVGSGEGVFDVAACLFRRFGNFFISSYEEEKFFLRTVWR